MFSIQPLLSPKGLLAAMIAGMLSGQAIAEVAGRVNFIAGEVSAFSADGSRRVLSRGDLVNSGERLETGRGRVQIRFTDGSFVSLQPNTVFGLDNYTYAKDKPNEGSLLFNFLRGGMRTVSGAIGKANRANYKVKTPVATIGIRGTGYAATQEANGRLLLSVSNGMVNLSNDFGNANVSAGQTFQTQQGKAPEPAPSGVSVSARADTPNAGDQQQNEEKSPPGLIATGNNGLSPDVISSNQVQENGKPAFVQTTNGVPRLSSFGSLMIGTDGNLVYANVLALFDSVSEDGQTVGNLIGLIGTEDDVKGQLLLDTNSATPLQFSRVQQVGTLSFGEWTNGTAALVSDHLQIGGLSLGSQQFMPYIVGTTAEKSLGNFTKASYSLVGATPARAGNSVGTLTRLNITIDYNLEPLVDVDMNVNIDNLNYTATTSQQPLTIPLDRTLSGFILQEGLYASSSDENTTCGTEGCPVLLNAFFSGVNDMGVVYLINRPELTPIGGVAALGGGDSVPVESAIPASDRLESVLNNRYTALFHTSLGDVPIPAAKNVAAIFDSQTGGWRTGFRVKNSNGEQTLGNIYGIRDTLDEDDDFQPAASISNIHHKDKILSWGTWTNGNIALNDVDTAVPNGVDVYYMIGQPSTTLPTSGNVTYHYSDGLSNSNLTVGGTIGVDFANTQSGMQLDLRFSGSEIFYQMTGTAAVSPHFTFNSLKVDGSNCGNCLATGFFAGTQQEMIGLKYTAQLDNTLVAGLAAFDSAVGTTAAAQ